MRVAVRVVPLLAVALALARRATRDRGATRAEADAPLPGDDLLGPGADVVATRAVTVGAPPADVWPWLAQLGHALVLQAGQGPEAEGSSVVPAGFTWAFVLRPGPHGSTRLLVRERDTCSGPWVRLGVEVVQVASSVVTARMLRGIREPAERRPSGDLDDARLE